MTSLNEAELNQTTIVSELEHDLTKSFLDSHLGGIDPTKRLELLKTAQTTYLHQSNWKKKAQERNPIINFDPKCLNCSDDIDHVQKLFKVACLAYKPTSVTHRGETFQRD